MKNVKIYAAAAVFCIIFFAVSVYAQPGTPDDPLVSRSYVNTRIAELEAQIAQLNAIISGGVEFPDVLPMQPSAVTRELFTVIRVEPGMVLIGGASTEIILRSGEATVVAGYNGLANVTTGVDVMNGQPVSLNNLLIVPQADGRGLRFHSVAHVMVKGDFHFMY